MNLQPVYLLRGGETIMLQESELMLYALERTQCLLGCVGCVQSSTNSVHPSQLGRVPSVACSKKVNQVILFFLSY